MFALITGESALNSRDSLEAMGAAIRHSSRPLTMWRDPDGGCGAAAGVGGSLPEDAFDRQPLVTAQRLLLCQARLDNRPELLDALAIDYVEAASMADSTLLALAFDRWGEQCVQRLSGDYAVAVWDRKERRGWAAVDPLGVRRLYWSRVERGMVVSAQLSALLAHSAISSRPDLPAMARLFDFGIDRASTPFESVAALPGGHSLHWGPHEVRVSRWWRPGTEATTRFRDPLEYVEQARELFDHAVTAQLRASGPLSTTLSGGLDSGLVTTTAAGQLASGGQRLTAYTAVPEPGLARCERPGWESDDGPYASAVAALYDNVEHRLVTPHGRCTLDLLEAFHTHARTPTKSVTNFIWLDSISASMRAAGSRVLLTGQSGNATISFRGSGALAETVTMGELGGAIRMVKREGALDRRGTLRVLAAALRLQLGALRRPQSRSNPGLALLQPDARPSPRLRQGSFAERSGTRAHWIAFATTPRNSWSPDPTAQWGVEWRDPTGDRWLVECLLRFPLHAFRTGGRERGLARTMAAGRMPDRVRLRSTQGSQLPEAPSLIALHADRYFAALSRMEHSAMCRELFDFATFRREVTRVTEGALDLHLAEVLDRAFDVGTFLFELEERR